MEKFEHRTLRANISKLFYDDSGFVHVIMAIVIKYIFIIHEYLLLFHTTVENRPIDYTLLKYQEFVAIIKLSDDTYTLIEFSPYVQR